MIHQSQSRTGRTRLGGSNILRQLTEKPTAHLSQGDKRLPVTIMGATGFDVQVTTLTKLAVGQRVTIIFTSKSPSFEVAIPGHVHCVSATGKSLEAGIVLQESLPREFEVRVPGCQRNSIRYACRLAGALQWNTGSMSSTSALAMNYSRDGICLQVACAPPIETAIVFVWKNGRQESQVEGIVRWVIGQEGGFLAGCQLTKDLGYKLGGL